MQQSGEPQQDAEPQQEQDMYWYAQEPSVLKQLDCAKLSKFHVQMVFAAGLGYFTTSYRFTMYTVLEPVLALLWYPSNPIMEPNTSGEDPVPLYGVLPFTVRLAAAASATVGVAAGQLLFGAAADLYGRKRFFGLSLLVFVIVALAQLVVLGVLYSSWSQGKATSTTTQIATFCVFRFVDAIPLGGDLPISAVMASEYSSREFRGTLLALVNLCSGMGQFTSVLISFTIVSAFEGQIRTQCSLSAPCLPLAAAWTTCFALSIIPPIICYWLRQKIPDSPRYTLHVLQNPRKARDDILHVMEGVPLEAKKLQPVASEPVERITGSALREYFKNVVNRKVVGSIAFCWFVVEAVRAATIPYTSDLLNDLGASAGVTPNDNGDGIADLMLTQLKMRMYLLVAGTLPGYLFAVIFIDRMGRKGLQYLGFFMMTVLLVVLGVTYPLVRAPDLRWVFLQLVALLLFYIIFGPAITTAVIPAELSPTKMRCTVYAITSLAAQIGTLFGTAVLGYFLTQELQREVLGILTLLSLLGLLMTMRVVEPVGQSLEDLCTDQDVYDKWLLQSANETSAMRDGGA